METVDIERVSNIGSESTVYIGKERERKAKLKIKRFILCLHRAKGKRLDKAVALPVLVKSVSGTTARREGTGAKNNERGCNLKAVIAVGKKADRPIIGEGKIEREGLTGKAGNTGVKRDSNLGICWINCKGTKINRNSTGVNGTGYYQE